ERIRMPWMGAHRQLRSRAGNLHADGAHLVGGRRAMGEGRVGDAYSRYRKIACVRRLRSVSAMLPIHDRIQLWGGIALERDLSAILLVCFPHFGAFASSMNRALPIAH